MHDFVHLHVHSEYSLLDGYATTKGIVERAAELGMDSIALTDHGVMYGVMDFYAEAKKAGVKPIIGLEAYVAPKSRHDAMVKGQKNYYHLLLLAKNEVGYRNLCKLTTQAHTAMGKGAFARPRIDWGLIEQHHEGLIVTSACIAGEVIQALLQRQPEQAREIAARYRDLLGPENYYLELQLHGNTPELEPINDELVRISKELGIPLVATSDSHFVRPNDLEAHTRVMAMGFNLTHKELCAKGYQMDESYHLLSGEQMWQTFGRYGTAALENTRRIADMCDLSFNFGRAQLPRFDLPEGHDEASYLRLVCEEGLMKRFAGNPPEEYVQRLAYELDVINQTGFPGYMLIVWDFVKFARSQGIPCLPRGSAGGSLALYCLFITDVDPVANGLVFERFLNPERKEMPDIDIDCADHRRGEVLEYIARKYGRENTAQVMTFSTLGAKSAIRDMAKVLEISYALADRVASLIPTTPAGVTIDQALERETALKSLYQEDARVKELVDKAKQVEGRMKTVGTHACGVVVSRVPLNRLLPLQPTLKDDQALMAAFDGPTLGKMGLLKIDLLGSSNLSFVAETLRMVEARTGQHIEFADIPLDDPKVFEALGRGETQFVFQLEGGGITSYLMQLKPTRVQDIYAMGALYRPGPIDQIPVYIHNKNNPQDITYLHPILEPILAPTYGVIVYQEQVLRILMDLAGYTMGHADIVRKAIGKKIKALMEQEAPLFKDGCRKQGMTDEQADTLWELIQPFAGYSFNLAHSTLYGQLSYKTAWLKVNYPLEYMTAVLTAAAGQSDEIAQGIAECRRLGLTLLPPDVNASLPGFAIEGDSIRFGLMAIRNVGEGPIAAILAARESGPFQSLEDFCTRVDRGALNKRVLESLIKSGAMDCLPGSRRQKLAVYEQVISAASETQRAKESGQVNMFDMFGDTSARQAVKVSMPQIAETPQDAKEQLGWEKEFLGVYLSEHPLARALEGVDTNALTQIGAIDDELVGVQCLLVGMLSKTRSITTKKGDQMMIATLEDMSGSIDLVVFPRPFAKYEAELVADRVLQIEGKIDRSQRDDKIQFVLDRVEPFSPEKPLKAPKPARRRAADPQPQAPTVQRAEQPILPPVSPEPIAQPIAQRNYESLVIELPRTRDHDDDIAVMRQLEQVLSKYVGPSPIFLMMPLSCSPGAAQATLRPRSGAKICPELLAEVAALIGEQAVSVSRTDAGAGHSLTA